jgi:hypothetical protein
MKQKLLLFILIVACPELIWANGGTALMLLPIFQLLVGNIVIGIVEGLIVTLIYKIKWYRSIFIMILGNYISWIIGNGMIYLFQAYIIESFFKLNGIFLAWIISMFILFIVTIVIEMPFFYWILKKMNRKWFHAFKISFIINFFTYIAMILIFLSISEFSFFTKLKVTQSLLKKNYPIELIIKQNNEIVTGKIGYPFKVENRITLTKEFEHSRFIFIKDSISNGIDLQLINNEKRSYLVQKKIISFSDTIFYPNFYKLFDQKIADFRGINQNIWDVNVYGWGGDGITIMEKEDRVANYAFEVPWMSWNINNVSIINKSELLFQIKDRLVLLNKDTKEIAYITKSDEYIIVRK